MSTQYQRNRVEHYNTPENENVQYLMKNMKRESSSSTVRQPLKVKDFNTENNHLNKPSKGDPSVKKSSKSKVDEEVAPLEIEELRRKTNGEGHTVHRYTRGKLLGKGGFAKVYMCTSMDTNRTYAVKIVPKANLKKTRARQKLQAEIKIHRSLKHKHICEYKHFFEDKNNCYILLELCHNQSMNELIKRRKRLTEPEVKYYLSQLLQSIQFMHEKNVIHRDLKLGNLFLDKHLKIKVGDFGLASKLSASDEKRKTICGTPNYIAPEVIEGDKEKRGHSFEVDIWSMGVIFYTLLIGKPPYESKDVKSTYQRILRNEYSFPSHIPISQHARDLISSMLQTRPDQRPSVEKIMDHPFFTHDPLKIPESLPPCCTHVAPDWQEERNGRLVPVLAEADEAKYMSKIGSKREDPMKESTSQKQRGHLAARDSKREESQQYYPTQQATRHPNHREANVRVSSQSTRKFEIYDDMPKEHHNQMRKPFTPLPQHERSHQFTADFGNPAMVDGITEKMEKINIQETPTDDKNADRCSAQQKASSDVELIALKVMHDRLRETNAKVEAAGGPANFQSIYPADDVGAETWVTRYVDYTSKYGLGFLFNDGSAGVYFNDSTKAVLAPKGNEFVYVERKKVGEGRMEQITEVHTLSNYPESLQKKVTLMKHFRNYLLEQHKREEKPEGDFRFSNERNGEDCVFLKKWVRTKHAILFRLSNQTVQVVFYDHTEILLSSEARIVTYVNKRRERETFYLEDIMNSVEHHDIKKRLKYVEGILQQLVAVPKK